MKIKILQQDTPQHNEELNNGRARRGGIQKLPQAVERTDLLGFPDNRRPAFLIPAQKGQYCAQHAEGKGKVKNTVIGAAAA